jgi:hypothetical protein
MTASAQLHSGTTQRYPRYGPSRHAYDFPKEDMVDLKYFPLSDSQEMCCHPKVHVECLQHSLETIQ